MKRVNIALWKVVVFLLMMSSQSSSWDRVCIDPGHGGIHSGTVGRVYGLLEKDVNFGVGHTAWNYFGLANYNPIMTRYEDVTVYATQRAAIANNANGGEGVDAFISIHHNAADDTTDTLTNGTETFWCNRDTTDGGDDRDTTRLLATKAYYKLRDKFHYPQRGVKVACWDVLRLTKMASTLSEASFLTCAAVERKFYYDFEDECAKEADALWRGGVSYLLNAGIAVVRNSYSGGRYGDVIVSKWDWWADECFETDTVASPYTACWLGGLFGESYCIEAITPQVIGGYERVFHHWAHLDPWGQQIEIYYEPLWKFEVPYSEEDYHRYAAYFTGGHYSAQVLSPDGNQIWHAGEEREIVWNVSLGADSTTIVHIYLDRNGGNDGYPEYLGSRTAKLGNTLTWTVTEPYSTHCRVKIEAEDIAENFAEDVSNNDFIISDSGNNPPDLLSHLQCKHPQGECADCVKLTESVTVEILADDPDGDSIFYEWWVWFGHFAENGQHSITTADNYVTYVAPAKAKEGAVVQFQDYISVYVTDVRGGQTWAVGEPELFDEGYSCKCGDPNDDGVVNVGDVVYLATYLYKGGPEPVEPTERGDSNNDCSLNVGDVVYLVTYLYRGGPPPECCWFIPGEKLELKGYSLW